MLRVGLTGGLGSGKSAVALVFADMGAQVLESDAIGRLLMQPGGPIYARIVGHFGPQVVGADGRLDRSALAALAFEQGHLAELNRIVHPAVIDAQERQIEDLARSDPGGIVVVESALIFEVGREQNVPHWHERFDRIVLVTAPEALKIGRYVGRVAGAAASASEREQAAADARRRLAHQIPDSEKIGLADYVIENDRSLVLLRRRAQDVFRRLRGSSI